MIAAGVAAERERSERAMADLMFAIGGVSTKLDLVADAIDRTTSTLGLHASLIGPMAEAFVAGITPAEAAEGAADPSTWN